MCSTAEHDDQDENNEWLYIVVEQNHIPVPNVSNGYLRNVNERKACKVTCCLISVLPQRKASF